MIETKTVPPSTLITELPTSIKFQTSLPIAEELQEPSKNFTSETSAKKSAKLMPFIFMHIACLGVFFVDISLGAVLLCIGLYALRMFALTAGYHRYFSHRSYKTSRGFQFVLVIISPAHVMPAAQHPRSNEAIARLWRLGRQVSYGFVSAQLKLRPARQAGHWALIGGKQIGPRRLCSSRQRRVLLMKTG